jgi:hypothetical protein
VKIRDGLSIGGAGEPELWLFEVRYGILGPCAWVRHRATAFHAKRQLADCPLGGLGPNGLRTHR